MHRCSLHQVVTPDAVAVAHIEAVAWLSSATITPEVFADMYRELLGTSGPGRTLSVPAAAHRYLCSGPTSNTNAARPR